MPHPPSLSIIILTHRSDERFESALASAQFAKEVLVIDYHSGAAWDTLKDIYHFQVISKEDDLVDFSAARNDALTYATQEWVLFLDSDEIIPKSSQPDILRIITDKVCAGATVRRQDYWHGRPLRFGEAGLISLLRMAKRNSIAFKRPVHEEADVQGTLCSSNITIHHFPHPTITSFYKSIVRYTQQEALHRTQQKQALFIPFIIIFPLGKFVLNFFFKLGFLDGWRGLVYAFMMSLHSLFVRVFWYEASHGTPPTTS